MKKKKVVYLVVIVLVTVGVVVSFANPSKKNLKEGDIIFQTSTSAQSKFIMMATGSRFSHCGIVVEKAGKLYVLEASSTLRLTPFDTFVKRGVGGRWKAKRVVDKPVKIKYRHLLGRPYDSAFKKDNNLFYCSELVHYIYATQFGIKLCEYRKVSDYHILGLDEELKKKGISKNEFVVAPSDIYNSKKVRSL